MSRRVARTGRQRGLGAIAAIVVLIMLAGMAAALLRLSAAATSGATQELQSVRANLAARSGLEWGLYQAARGGWTACTDERKTLDLHTDFGMNVTVSCSSDVYREGESQPGVPSESRVFTLEATACPSSGECPDESRVADAGYVERVRRIHVVQ